MWAAERPSASVTDAARACARGTRDKEVAGRLLAAQKELEINSRALQRAARGHKLRTVTPQAFVVSGLSDKQMKWMYTAQLGRSGRPASVIRDQLVGSAPHGLCCYCQYGQATTLDHFVPKELVPALSIDPWNLVPACQQCNHKLQSLYGASAEEQMLHPYAMPELGRWLYAEIGPGIPTNVTFRAKPDHAMGSVLQERILYEFESLGLGFLFSVVSGPDLSEMDATLTGLFDAGRSDLVRAHLLDTAATAMSVAPNSRRGALFEALADDDAYCAGGYGANKPVRFDV